VRSEIRIALVVESNPLLARAWISPARPYDKICRKTKTPEIYKMCKKTKTLEF